MKNPWEEIDLEIYESHMRLDSVMQLQAMNAIMKKQLEAYPAATAMILGVAGGNGLEHIRRGKYHTVYGVDINADYLRAVSERYQELSGVLQCLQIDLTKYADQLPEAQLLIANLLIEYIGYASFQNAVLQVRPMYVSCRSVYAEYAAIALPNITSTRCKGNPLSVIPFIAAEITSANLSCAYLTSCLLIHMVSIFTGCTDLRA